MTSSAKLKDTWLFIFNRRGGRGTRAGSWDECDGERRGAAIAGLQLEDGELPVLVSWTARGIRLLLTTSRLVSGVTEMRVGEIVGVHPVEFGRTPKSQIMELDISVSGGQTVRIETEPGRPYFGLLGVLQNIVSRNIGTDTGLRS